MFHNHTLLDASRTPFVAAAGGPFVGIGDLATYSHYFGLRAYSTAQMTGSVPAIQIVKSTDGSDPHDIMIATSGHLDTVSANAIIASWGVPAKVNKLYDQLGTPVLIQTTLSLMPILAIGASGLRAGRASLQFNNALGIQTLTGTGHADSILHPFCYTVFAIRRGGFSDGASVCGTNGSYPQLLWQSSGANNFAMYAGTTVSVPSGAAASTWHAINALYNGASSSVRIDGTNNTGLNPGTSGEIGTTPFFIAAADVSAQCLTGDIAEFGVASSDISANFAAVSANQLAYW